MLPGREEPGPDATHVAPAPGGPGSTRPAPRRAAPLPPNRRRFVWPLMIAALLIVVGALVLARKPKTTVPELRGLSRGGVSARAGRHELKPDFARRYSSSTPRNVAISQDPEPGARVGEGSTVRVTLSDGPAPVAVPQLKGKGIAAARDALDKVGLRASVRERTSAGTPSGTVLGQSPAPPAKAVPGTSVRADRGGRAELAHGHDLRAPRTTASRCRSGSAASGGASSTDGLREALQAARPLLRPVGDDHAASRRPAGRRLRPRRRERQDA